MGSSKKSKSRKAVRVDASVAGGLEASEAIVATGDGVDHDSVAGLADSIDQLADRLSVVELQLERALLLQHRTNTLLELLAGSAFDAELGREP